MAVCLKSLITPPYRRKNLSMRQRRRFDKIFAPKAHICSIWILIIEAVIKRRKKTEKNDTKFAAFFRFTVKTSNSI